MDPKAKEISNAKEWVKETNRSVVYGVCTLVAGAVATLLAHQHDLPVPAQVALGVVAGLVGAGMIIESNFYASRKHLRQLQNPSEVAE